MIQASETGTEPAETGTELTFFYQGILKIC